MSRSLSFAAGCAALVLSVSVSAGETQPRLELGAAFQPLTDEALGALRGAGFWSDFLAALPQSSIATVQVGDTTVTDNVGPVYSVSLGGATATATTGTGTATSTSFSSSTTMTTTRTFTRTFTFP